MLPIEPKIAQFLVLSCAKITSKNKRDSFISSLSSKVKVESLPIKWFSSGKKFQHDHSKTVDVAVYSVLTRHGNLRCAVS